MNDDSTLAILEEIDATLAAIGQPDYDAFRALLARASVLLHNVALLSARFAVPSREELVRFIQEMPPDEREQKLRLLVGMRQYLPTIGKTVIAATERVFPKSQGGAPSKFKDRDAIRQACELIMSFIRSGQSESVAKKSAAKKLKVSRSTIDRAWKQRAIVAELSVEEFVSQFFGALVQPSNKQDSALSGGPQQQTNTDQNAPKDTDHGTPRLIK